VKYLRYVDDILILCAAEDAERNETFTVEVLKNRFDLAANSQKTKSGRIRDGVPFLGMYFTITKLAFVPQPNKSLKILLKIYSDCEKKMPFLIHYLFGDSI
jgi:hypothetical protein